MSKETSSEAALPLVARQPQRLFPLLLGIAIALLSLYLFERLADEMLEGETRQFDSAVRNFVHSFASPWLTRLMRVLTTIGNIDGVVVLTAVACVLLWLRHKRNGAVLLAIDMLGALLLMWSLKLLFHRQRPEPYFGITIPSDYSFPSGHALVAFCFYSLLAVLITTGEKRTVVRIAVWFAAGIMIAGIGLSRVYLGVHYPSDIVAGYLAALFWITAIFLVNRRFRQDEKPTETSISETTTGVQ